MLGLGSKSEVEEGLVVRVMELSGVAGSSTAVAVNARVSAILAADTAGDSAAGGSLRPGRSCSKPVSSQGRAGKAASGSTRAGKAPSGSMRAGKAPSGSTRAGKALSGSIRAGKALSGSIRVPHDPKRPLNPKLPKLLLRLNSSSSSMQLLCTWSIEQTIEHIGWVSAFGLSLRLGLETRATAGVRVGAKAGVGVAASPGSVVGAVSGERMEVGTWVRAGAGFGIVLGLG